MMLKKIVLSLLLCGLAACGSKPRAGSLYEQPEFMSLMPVTSWKKGDVSHDFARQIFNNREGALVTSSGEFLKLGSRYVSALGMACQRFSSQTTHENWVLCAQDKTLNDAVVVRAF